MLTEELLCAVTAAMDLASTVQGEGHVYLHDTVWTCSGLSFSSSGYDHPRFSFELVLYHPQTKHCSTCQHQISGWYFSEWLDISPYHSKRFRYCVGAKEKSATKRSCSSPPLLLYSLRFITVVFL